MVSEELHDWRLGLSLSQRQKYMFDGQYGCDVTFLVGQGKRQESISAHRFVLICGSPVFEEMLERRGADEMGPVTVGDVEPGVFRSMLQFLYCEDIQITADNALSLLHIAEKYIMSQLIRKCIQFLHDNLCIGNVCKILTESLKYQEAELSAKCVDIIGKHTEEVLKSDEFVSLSHASLVGIIGYDLLSGVTESEIYAACLKWADVQCRNRQEEVSDANRRAALGEVIYQIRFTTMSTAEFSRLTSSSSVLTPFERLYIHDQIAADGKSLDAASYGCRKFNTAGRKNAERVTEGKPVKVVRMKAGGASGTQVRTRPAVEQIASISSTSMERHINRFSSISAEFRWTYENSYPDIIDFTSDRSTTLVGVCLYGGSESSNHEVSVTLVDDLGTTITETGSVTMTSDGTTEPIPIGFPNAVCIPANVRHSVRAMIQGPSTYSGKDGQTAVTDGDVRITFHKTSVSKHGGTDVNGGQIPTLIFFNEQLFDHSMRCIPS